MSRPVGKERPTGRLVVPGIVVFEIVHNKEAGGREAPGDAWPRTVGIGVIDLVNAPVVCGIQLEFSGVIALSTWKAGAYLRNCLITV